VSSLEDYRSVLARVYADDPAFVHPDVGFLRRLLEGDAAYLKHGRARAFAVPGEAFAMGFVDPRVQAKTGVAVGSIGFFEAIGREPAVRVLSAACTWLAGHGVVTVLAPFNGNPFYGVGLREDRFGEPPFVGCAHQPAEYPPFLEAAGFTRATGYLNFEIDLEQAGPPKIAGVGFREASRRRFRDEIARFMSMHNDAFRDVWGEAEVSAEEALELMGRAKLAIPRPLFQFAVVDGRDVGMVLCMPDVNEVAAPQRAPLTSASGVWKMATRRRRVRTVGLLSVGVLAEYQGRGIGTALVARACEAARTLGFARMEYALVAESNEASKSTVARFGGKLCRRFGVYAKEL
jgi:GNAT superfamily N-acetyltransferase